MASGLTETSVTRSLDASGDEIKTFRDSDSREIQAVAVTDRLGDHAGIPSNPLQALDEDAVLALRGITDVLRRIEFQLSLITGHEGGGQP